MGKNVLEIWGLYNIFEIFQQGTEAYSEPSQTYKMERFVKTVSGQKPLIIFTKRSILDAWQGSEYTTEAWKTGPILSSCMEGDNEWVN